MDAILSRFDAEADGDLMICAPRGVAWQRDMSFRAPPGVNAEGVNYFDHYSAFAGAAVGKTIHDGRVAFVNDYVGRECPVLDVGIGCGDFIKARPHTYGMDVNPVAQQWLSENGRQGLGIDTYQAFTFWDVLEHVEAPNVYFKKMRPGSFLFTSLPIFDDLSRVRESKHYKPGEHLYYWTEAGFVEWMAMYRFRLLAAQDFETDAGRDGIRSFAFVRDLPGYHETLEEYRKLHANAYGTTAYLYFDKIAKEVLNTNPLSILDYGCGRGDLVAHFWKDGERRIAKYDPAIPQFKEMPQGDFDLVLCTDVMEHILIADVERVFREIRGKSQNAIFTISLRPARAHLPDGRNAHVTLLSASEWLRWIKDAFGRASRVDTGHEHLLMAKTF